MLDKDTIIKVTNRDSGSVGYTVAEMGVHRKFQKGEVKEIRMEELRKLSYLPGGQAIINDCLIIHNEEALKELNPDYEPEYFYTEADIRELLLKGTEAQFLDCLDFAPEGVIELVKQLAVELKVNDLAKREAILNKTGFNVTRAIQINEESQEVDEPDTEVKQRRAAAPTTKVVEPEATGRRTAAPKYGIKNK
jgi:hypothetical protein